ncbi:ceramidase domain-containing protein [Mangrovicoccus algicola]|uniref:Ceramidase domain-containing protein n=1 Tax=Mangrovicoccus algicola TaxID=2771008 RepID=A0A8J7D1B5_9RHOB|nr:ceramidase domain-containing protein [Mangrovicoccus algicola]MBE3640588.1 ceramidase domain-containing protein [Mangrovicoccus algicola]
MEWTRQIDGYCERLDASFWAEPVNAATNLAFVLAAWIMWRRCRGQGLMQAPLLCLLLAAIGIGSFLFHTLATAWAGLADVIPIGCFVLAYLYTAHRNFWRLPVRASKAATAMVIPYAMLTVPVFEALPGFAVSAVYWPVPVLIAVHALALSRRAPATARGLGIGAGLLCLSLVARSLDESLCSAWPIGTHFAWHLLNAAMLGWMIEVYRRHMVAGRPA